MRNTRGIMDKGSRANHLRMLFEANSVVKGVLKI